MIARIAAAAAAGLALSGHAHGQQVETAIVYTAITADDLRTMLEELGYIDIQPIPTGFEMATSSGFFFATYLSLCDGADPKKPSTQQCRGLEIGATWEMEEGQAEAVRMAADRHNQTYTSLKVWVTDDNVLSASRYETLDGGVTWDHLALSIDAFLGNADFMASEVLAETGVDFTRSVTPSGK